MSSSETGPAVMPSGGLDVRFLYSEKRRLAAREEAIWGDGEVVGWLIGWLGGERSMCGGGMVATGGKESSGF